MKSKTCLIKRMKASSKGQLWIPAFFFLGYLLAFDVMELLRLGSWFRAEELDFQMIQGLYQELWKNGFGATGFVVTALGAVISGVQGFWYLYSGAKTDFYHGLPLKRKGLFLERICTAMLYYAIPYVIMAFLAVCIGAARGLFSGEILRMAVLMFLVHSLLYLLFYFCTVLVICLTGNLLMGVLCLGGMILYGEVLATVILRCRMLFYKTTYQIMQYGLVRFLKEYASPYGLGKNLLEQYSGSDVSSFLRMLAVVVCVTAILGVLSYLAFLKRPSESAGKPVIYDWVGVILKFMVVVPCGLGCGIIFRMLPDGGSRDAWWIFGMILGCVLSHGILEVVYQMDFQKFAAKKHHLVLCGLLVAVCAANYKMDLLKFDAYFPEQDALAALNFNFDSPQDEILVVQTENGEFYQSIGSWASEENALTKEEGVGTRTWQALKQITEKQSRNMDYRYVGGGYVTVKYTLKSGREVYRRYQMDAGDLRELYAGLYDEGTLKERRKNFSIVEPKYLENVECSFGSGEHYRVFQGQPDKQRELLDALAADLEEASTEELLEQPCVRLELEYKLPREEIYRYISDTFYQYFTVYVYPSFQRTVAILKETGYAVSIEESDLEKVVIAYVDPNTGRAQEPVTYETEEELRELKKALVSGSLTCSWIPMERNLAVEYYLSGGDGQESNYGGLMSEKLPDFVKKMKEEAGDGQTDPDAQGIQEADPEE